MKSSQDLGGQVVSLIKQRFQLPEEYRNPLCRICRDKYGVNIVPAKIS